MNTIKPSQEDIASAERLLSTLDERFAEEFDARPDAAKAPIHRLGEQFPDLHKAMSRKLMVENWLWQAVHRNECRITFSQLQEAASA